MTRGNSLLPKNCRALPSSAEYAGRPYTVPETDLRPGRCREYPPHRAPERPQGKPPVCRGPTAGQRRRIRVPVPGKRTLSAMQMRCTACPKSDRKKRDIWPAAIRQNLSRRGRSYPSLKLLHRPGGDTRSWPLRRTRTVCRRNSCRVLPWTRLPRARCRQHPPPSKPSRRNTVRAPSSTCASFRPCRGNVSGAFMGPRIWDKMSGDDFRPDGSVRASHVLGLHTDLQGPRAMIPGVSYRPQIR